MADSTVRRDSVKPANNNCRKSWGLFLDFPLFPLGDPGQPDRLRWCKKIRKKLEYFGELETDPKGQRALERWLRDQDYLFTGRPRPAGMLGSRSANCAKNSWERSGRMLTWANSHSLPMLSTAAQQTLRLTRLGRIARY